MAVHLITCEMCSPKSSLICLAGRVDGYALASFRCLACGRLECQNRHALQEAGVWPCTPSATRVKTFIHEDVFEGMEAHPEHSLRHIAQRICEQSQHAQRRNGTGQQPLF